MLALALLGMSAPVLAQTTIDPNYRLGANDEIKIAVLEDDGLNLERRVSSSGAIVLPMIGEVQVAGQTVEEVRTAIKSALERDFLRMATVDVEVLEARSQPISITGAVKNPGTVYMGGVWRLSQALAAAGGVAEGNQGIVEIRRQAANGLSDRLQVDLAALVQRGDETLDIPILARDAIKVLVASDITVYFLGEIRSQGAVTIKGTERPSLLTAIAKAGGLTDRASSRLVIRRDRAGKEPLEIVANFKKILAGDDPDIELQHGDLIVVKEAFL